MNEQILRILGVPEINKLDEISDGFCVYPTEEQIIATIKAELMTSSPSVENSLIALMYQTVFDRAKAYATEQGMDATYFTTHSSYYVNALDSHLFIDGDHMYKWQDVKRKIDEMIEEGKGVGQ